MGCSGWLRSPPSKAPSQGSMHCSWRPSPSPDSGRCLRSPLVATKRLLQRAFEVFRDRRYARLATLSVSHLYTLRGSAGYRAQRTYWSKTRGSPVLIGVRRAPAPEGRPGFIRIDSVHQGDQDGLKGVYHINAVDCVTQWAFVACCERISEAYLRPVIEALLTGFPFVIRGFHADNGSEYVNHWVAELLEKLRIEFSKPVLSLSKGHVLATSQ